MRRHGREMTSDFRSRIDLHGWASLGHGGFYCGIVIGETLSVPGRLAAIGMGVLGVVATLKAFLHLGPSRTLRENILSYWDTLLRAQKGLSAFLVTLALTVGTLAGAIVITSPGSEVRMGASNGLRSAVYLMVFAGVWRLSIGWRMTALGAWVIFDLMVFAKMGGGKGVPENGNGLLTLIVTVGFGWLLLVLQDALDPGQQ